MLLYHNMFYGVLLGWALKTKERILDFLFPLACLSCKSSVSKEDGFLCHLCSTQIFINKTLICPDCQSRLAENKKFCHKNSKYLLAAATFYDDTAVKNLIWQLKYRKQRAALIPLWKILDQYLQNISPAFNNFKKFVVMPMPLHKEREKSRGFNQSLLFAEKLAEKFGLPLNKALLRTRNTPPQAEIRETEKRKINVAECFTVQNPLEITKRNILLVDDVSTSGATLNEAAKTLKSAGARKIIGLVIAKTR